MKRIQAFAGDSSNRRSSDLACRTSLARRVISRTKSDPEEIIEAVCEAARDGKLNIVKKLCSTADDTGIDICDLVNINIADQLPLIAAARNGHLPVVKWLVSNGARINEKNGRGQIALNRAARHGHFEVVKWIVQCCGSVNDVDGDNRSVLHEAVSIGHFSMVKWLIEQGANVETMTACGQTVLHLAANSPNENVALVKFLVENGMSEYSVDNRGHSALYYTIIAKNFEILKFFLRKCTRKEHLDRSDLWHAAFGASKSGQLEIMELLNKNHGIDMRKANYYGRTALHEAATGGAINSVELLIRLGVDVNQADSFGTTPIIEACRHGWLDILSVLLDARANILALNLAGRTAIHYAAEGGHKHVLDILISHGADINCCDMRGWTPLHCAVAECRFEMTEALIKNGAARDKMTDAGKTALNLAVERGHLNLSQYLLQLEDCKTTLDEGENAALVDYTDYLLDPKEIHFDALGWHDNVEGLWLDSPIKVKVKEKWWSTNFIQELSLWSRLNHPHVVKMYGMCYGEGVEDPFFVYERPTYGSLLEHSKASNNNMLATLWDKLYEVALGLQYLHDRKIVHGDLRCNSIVIAANGVAKLQNLGSEDITNDDRLQWTAPEILFGFPLSFQSDVFAFGITIVEVIKNGQNLWDGIESSALRDAILSGQLPLKPAKMTFDQWDLIKRMCSYNPQNRITASDVVRELEIFTREYEIPEYKTGRDSLSARFHPREVRDVISNKFSTALRIPSTLADIGKMCRPTTDMDRMNRDVYERLVDVFEQLKLRKDTSNSALTHEYMDILRYFSKRLKSIKVLKPIEAARIAASRQVADSAFAVHRDIDSFMDNAELPRLTSIHKWRDLWELHHTRQQDEFLAKVDNLSALSANLDDGAYLLFELSKYPTSYPTNKSNEFTRAESALIALKNADWFIPPYEVEFDKFSSFNRGAFGKVYHGKWKRSQIVVKKVKLRNEEDKAAFFNEVEIWHKLYHPHVVQLFGACNIGKPFFVCEYAGCGQLDNYLRDHPDELWGKFVRSSFGSTVPTREACDSWGSQMQQHSRWK